MPGSPTLIDVDGSKGKSVILRGKLDAQTLSKLEKGCEIAHRNAKTKVSLRDVNPHESVDVNVRMCDKVKKAKVNGAFFGDLAPSALAEFHAELAKQNSALYKKLADSANSWKLQYTHGKKEMKAIETAPKDGFFAYASIKKFPNSPQTGFHCDGGPSTVFLAIAIKGHRGLEYEDAQGNRFVESFGPGDFYVSSPSTYWHRVVAGELKGPTTTLILRSDVLTTCVSGGHAKSDGSRTCGLMYGTAGCVKELARKFAKLLKTHGFKAGGASKKMNVMSPSQRRRALQKRSRGRLQKLKYACLEVQHLKAYNKIEIQELCNNDPKKVRRHINGLSRDKEALLRITDDVEKQFKRARSVLVDLGAEEDDYE